jgi:alpha-tubulin suppressor-like RCC1 family protein
VTEPAEIPQLPGGHGISEVSAGPFHTTVLAHSGSVFGFGDGALGQLGRLELDANHRSPLPRLIPGLNHIAVRSVSCGAYHTALTDEIGDLWTFGSNEKGQLGIGNLPLTALEKIVRDPQKVVIAASSGNSRTQQCCCGFDFTVVLLHDGGVRSFGNGESGQLGLGYDANKKHPKSSSSPKSVPALSHARISLVAVGDSHSLFLSADGRVFACGKHSFGRLGLGKADADVEENSNPKASVPRRVHFNPKQRYEKKDNINGDHVEDVVVIGAIYAGAAASFAVSSSGSVFAWGSNTFGALGLAHQNDVHIPTMIPAFAEIDVRTISVGSDHCCFLSWTGNVYVAGSSRRGRLGLHRDTLCEAVPSGNDGDIALNEPFLLEYFPTLGLSVDYIAVGGAHSFAACFIRQHGDSRLSVGELRGILSSERSIAIGKGISDPAAQKDAVFGPKKTQTWHEFIVQIRDAFGKNCGRSASAAADLRVTVSCASALTASVSSLESDIEGWARKTSTSQVQCIQVKACDRRDGTYRICYQLRHPGRVSISCSLDGESIHNSPFQVQLENSKIAPPPSSNGQDVVPLIAFGDVLDHAMEAGATATFSVEGGQSSRQPPFNAILKPIDTDGRPPPSSSSLGIKVVAKKNNRPGTCAITWICSFNIKVAGTYLLLLSAPNQGVCSVRGNPWTICVTAGKLHPGRSSVTIAHTTLETFGLYECSIHCSDAFGNSVSSLDPSELSVHISGGQVQLAANTKTKKKGNSCSVVKVDEVPGEYAFSLSPITRGSAHVLVSTRNGERFQGTPIPITVVEGASMPAATCSVAAFDIDGQQGGMYDGGEHVAVLASSSEPLALAADVWVALTFRDVHNRSVHMSVPELQERIAVVIDPDQVAHGTEAQVNGPPMFELGEAAKGEEAQVVKMRVSLKCMISEDKELGAGAPLVGHQMNIRLILQLQGQAVVKPEAALCICVLDNAASWWWHVKRRLPVHVVVPPRFLFRAPIFGNAEECLCVCLDLKTDAEARNVVEAGARLIERLHAILKPSQAVWRDCTTVGLQPWLGSLQTFSSFNLGEKEEKTDPSGATIPFSRWLRTECKDSPAGPNIGASWGHLLLCKMAVDRAGLFRCFMSDGKCFCTGLQGEGEDEAAQEPIQVTWRGSPEVGPDGCFSLFINNDRTQSDLRHDQSSSSHQ